ncbi:unnamed protein product, partial [marine sediment metagenome]
AVLDYTKQHEENFMELDVYEKVAALESYVSNTEPYKGGIVQKAKRIVDELKKIENERLATLKQNHKNQVETMCAAIIDLPEYTKLRPDKAKQLIKDFKDDLNYKIDNAANFSSVRDKVQNYGIKKQAELRKQIIRLVHPEEKIVFATKEEKQINYSKHILMTKEDVEGYVKTLRSHYLKLIEAKKRIEV